MRKSREEAEQTRQRIVERAAVLFRARGIDGIGLADLMQEAGLTHGGFYRHFASKEGLAAEACAHALKESARRMRRRAAKNPEDPLTGLVEGFLSDEHVADAGRGCAVAALGSDMFRCAPATRAAFTEGVRELIEVMAELQPQSDPDRRRETAMTGFAAMLGALVIARGVSDPALRRDMLAAMRRHLLSPVDDETSKRARRRRSPPRAGGKGASHVG
jgi:TetR/AcrR family transcriptional regulator, transcriptional repressor for nem operon